MHQTMDKTRAPASKTLIEIDLSESPYKNDMIHNRWHPDIPMVAWVKPGDEVPKAFSSMLFSETKVPADFHRVAANRSWILYRNCG